MPEKNEIKRMKLRASRIPLFLKCACSIGEPEIEIQQESEASRTGTCVHEVLAEYIRDGIEPGNLTDDERFLFYVGKKIWNEKLIAYFPTPQIEIPMSYTVDEGGYLDLTGTADVIQIGSDFVAVLDWKTGRVERDYTPQLQAYGLLAALMFDKPKAIVSIANLRTGEITTQEFKLSQFTDFHNSLIKQLDSDIYNAGQHCEFCPNALYCQARTALIENAVKDLSGIELNISRLAFNDKLHIVYAARKMLAVAIDKFDEALKFEIEKQGNLDSGGFIFSLETRTRKEIDAEKATPLLTEKFSANEILSFLKINKTDLEKAVMSKVEKGEKTNAVKAFMGELENAGAIKTTESKVLSVKPIKKELE
jgi:hypothetical protein